jgi:hypothetical protein
MSYLDQQNDLTTGYFVVQQVVSVSFMITLFETSRMRKSYYLNSIPAGTTKTEQQSSTRIVEASYTWTRNFT